MNLLQIVSDARSIVTLVCMVTFIAIVIWAYSSRRTQDFEEAAMLPFADEEQLTEEQESRHG
ncbi:MAG: Cbb3-type cytochrome oxidase component FixQ [Pseudomonadota bacterium]|jgi:cytochrome c oxidase cbb3-type subunit 4